MGLCSSGLAFPTDELGRLGGVSGSRSLGVLGCLLSRGGLSTSSFGILASGLQLLLGCLQLSFELRGRDVITLGCRRCRLCCSSLGINALLVVSELRVILGTELFFDAASNSCLINSGGSGATPGGYLLAQIFILIVQSPEGILDEIEELINLIFKALAIFTSITVKD